MAYDSRVGKMYIRDLPSRQYDEICRILDEIDDWEDLAINHMGIDNRTIQQLKRQRSPTDNLLRKWGYRNHTVSELFILFSKVEHYLCMTHLKPFVDPRQHDLIYKGNGNLMGKSRRFYENFNSKDLKIGPQNFNSFEPAQNNTPKVIVNRTDDELSGEKILNGAPLPSSPTSSDLSTIQQLDTSKINNELSFSLSDTGLPQIPYDDLVLATGRWSSCTLLGKGGFGMVYKGTWKNAKMAIKKIELDGPDAYKSYLLQLQEMSRELKILNSYSYRHDNVLPLYAYSMGPDASCLVNELMLNGSLEDRLFPKQPRESLTWLQRHEIAKGTARGLQFLHTVGDKPLIHGNIKSSNIMLDRNFEPRITDFGLSRKGFIKDSANVSTIHGMKPYLPEEFFNNKTLSTKIDTYSYGIVMFELASGLRAYDETATEDKSLKDYIDNHPTLLPFMKDKKTGAENEQVFIHLIGLGKWCTDKLPQNRPEMDLVVRKIDDV